MRKKLPLNRQDSFEARLWTQAQDFLWLRDYTLQMLELSVVGRLNERMDLSMSFYIKN